MNLKKAIQIGFAEIKNRWSVTYFGQE